MILQHTYCKCERFAIAFLQMNAWQSLDPKITAALLSRAAEAWPRGLKGLKWLTGGAGRAPQYPPSSPEHKGTRDPGG